MLFCKKKAVSPALLRTSDSAELREAYNRIRTALASRTAGIPCPVIGIATPAEGEGGAACAENLAFAFARLGRRVLLIDADLRAPEAPAVFGEGKGFSDLLDGEKVTPVACDEPNLFLLSRGSSPKNPADLLGSAAFSEKLEELKVGFDAVFISLPPVCGMADTAAVAPRLTGTVLALALRATDRRDAQRAVMLLHDLGTTLLGTVTVG